MKKKYLTIVLIILIKVICFSQNSNEKITIKFNNTPLISAINQIEGISNYEFYYLNSWVSKIKVSGDFKNQLIDNVLLKLLKDTSLNFYIGEKNKVFLTQNSIIYNTLPRGFLTDRKEEGNKSNDFKPIFIKNNNNQKEIVKVGKASSRTRLRKYRLTGFVKNKVTKEAVENVAIVVKGKNIATTTDSKGYYSILLETGYNTIELSAIGLEKITQTLLLYNKGTLNFEMNEALEVLDEIEIFANKEDNVVKPITGVSHIEVAKIKTIPLVLGESDIFKVATTLPGISTAGEGASGYNVRGGKTDQNLILLDEMIIYNPTHFFGIFSGINPFVLKSADIYKGNIPAEYGGRLSSVFDIKTKNASTEKFKGEASIGPVTSNLALEIPIIKNKSSLLIGGRTTYSNWVLKSLDSESLKNSEVSFYDIITKYYHKLNENNSLKISGYVSKDKFRITSDSLYTFQNKLLSITWNHKLNEKHSLKSILTNTYYGFNIDYQKENLGGFDLGYNINETEFKLKLDYKRNKIHDIDYGVSAKLYSVNPGNIKPIGVNSSYAPINIPKEKAFEFAAFASDNIKFNKKLELDLGMRYTSFMFLGPSSQRIYESNLPKSPSTLLETKTFKNNEIVKTYGGLETRGALRYSFTDDFSIKGSYNTAFQYIHTLSNNTTASPTDTWKISDINIKPQSSEQYSLGLYKNFKEGVYEVSVEGYYKNLKNTLDYKTGAKLLLNQTIETKVLQGSGKSYGLEFLVKKTRGNLNGWLGYTYSRSLNKFESSFPSETINRGEYFSSNFDKPHDFSLVANYKFTKRYSLSLNGVYQTGRPVTFPTSKYILNNIEYVAYSDRNKFRIPDYYRVDLSFNIEGNHKIKKFVHSFWSISIYNLLGRNNPYSVFFVTEDSKIKAYQSSIFSIPVPTITYNFKF